MRQRQASVVAGENRLAEEEGGEGEHFAEYERDDADHRSLRTPRIPIVEMLFALTGGGEGPGGCQRAAEPPGSRAGRPSQAGQLARPHSIRLIMSSPPARALSLSPLKLTALDTTDHTR